MHKLLFLLFCTSVFAAETEDIKPLTRQLSSTLSTADLLPLETEVTLLQNGASMVEALVPETPEAKAAFAPALKQLESAWNLPAGSIKKTSVAPAAAGKTLLVFGNDSGTLSRRLQANWLTEGGAGYEVRSIPNALDLKCHIVYFGGQTAEDILAGVQAFCAAFPPQNQSLSVAGLHLTSEPPQNAGDAPRDYLAEMRTLYQTLPAYSNTKGIRLLSAAAREFYQTGDERLPETFIDMLHVFADGYEGAKAYSWRKPPPVFISNELPKACDLIEEALSETDRVFCGEMVRRITEDNLNYKDMKEPIEIYAKNENIYLSNHPLFASRGVNCAARWLKSRFDIPAADYWLAVSAHAYKGMTETGIGPEDAGSYQFISPRLFVEFCMASGEMDYKTPALRTQVDYSASLLDGRGWRIPFGDVPPMSNYHGWNFLKWGYQIYGDELYAWLLKNRMNSDYVKEALKDTRLPDNPDPGDRLLGLTVFELNRFLLQHFEIDRYFDRLPALSKAVFRSGWGDNEQALVLGGQNIIGWHGHFDANSIIHFGEGDRYWLVDGDYNRAFPRYHNSLEVSRNGKAPDLRAVHADTTRSDTVAELRGSATHPSNQQAITVSCLRNYDGFDWVRHLLWDKETGTAVVDVLKAKAPGRYLTRLSFRTLGDVQETADGFTVVQKPSQITPNNLLHIRKADASVSGQWAQFDYGHGGVFGYYDAYPYSGPVTQLITARQKGFMEEGQTQTYAHFFQTASSTDAEPTFMRLSDNAWKLDGRSPALFVTGEYRSGTLHIDADALYMTDRRLTACGVRQITVDGFEYKGPQTSFTAEFSGTGEGFSALAPAQAAAMIRGLVPQDPTAPALETGRNMDFVTWIEDHELEEIAPSVAINTESPITALDIQDNRIVIGAEDGTVSCYSQAGQMIWQAALNAPVTALAPIELDGQTGWIAGTRYADRQSQAAYVALISPEGTLRWKTEVPAFRERPGSICSLSAAKLTPDGGPQIVAASESWRCFAFDINGQELWQFVVDHAATEIEAADFDGDGLDEVMVGSEYAQSWLLESDGTLFKQIYSSKGYVSAAVGDLTGDGKLEGVLGGDDSFIKVLRFVPRKQEKSFFVEANVGGLPTGMFFLPEGSKGRLAVATDMGTLVFLNARGKTTGITEFPDAIDTAAFDGETLYARCRNGRVYFLNGSGEAAARSIQLPAESSGWGSLIAAFPDGGAVVACQKQAVLFMHE